MDTRAQQPFVDASARPVFAEADGKLMAAVKTAPTLLSGLELWRGFTMEVLDTPASETPPHTNLVRHLVCTIDSEEPFRFYWRERGRERSNVVSAGDNLIRSQQDLVGFRWDGSARALILGIEPARMLHIAGEILQDRPAELQECFGTNDDYIHRLMRALAADLRQGCPTGAVLGESICSSIAVYSLQRFGVADCPVREYKNGLSQARIKQIAEYVDSRLAMDLSLFELADIAGMSPYYLTRLFRTTFGVTLHQYILARRVERAKHLLRRTHLDLFAIAGAVGFTHHSHFSQVFRKRTGVTPFDFRAGV